MPEIGAPRAVDPAQRTASVRPPETATKTPGSVAFASCLKTLSRGPHSAHRPTHAQALPGRSQTPVEEEPAALQRRSSRGADEGSDVGLKEDGAASWTALLDPLLCQMAPQAAAGEPAASTSSAASVALPLTEELQTLLTGLSRRVAWGGDRRRGSARIELSEGVLAGSTLLIHADQHSVSVELEVAPGTSAQGWEARLAERLEARGFTANVRVG